MAGVFGRERMEVVRRGRRLRDERLQLTEGLGRGVRARVRPDGRVRVWPARSDRHEVLVPVFRGRLTAQDGDVVTLAGRCRLDLLGWAFTVVFIGTAALGLTTSPPDRSAGLLLAAVMVGVFSLVVAIDRRTYAEGLAAIESALPGVLAQATRSAARERKRERSA